MNYYTLSDYPAITIDELIHLFQSGETINIGAISVFGDSIGKPGDIIYDLKSINKINTDSIEFEFKNLRVLVKNPIFIVSNEKIIGIESCSKIEWIDEGRHLVYETIGGNLETKIISGNHFFRTKENKDALMIYTW